MYPKGQRSSPANPCGVKVMLWIRDVALPYQGDDCLIWPFHRERTGYGRFGQGPKRRIFAHRYICEWINGPPPTAEHHAAHSCGNGREGCVNRRHLRWATPIENQQDGRQYPARKMGMAKASEIRALKGVLTEDTVAAKYGVSERTVRRIFQGQIWASGLNKHGHPITKSQAN